MNTSSALTLLAPVPEAVTAAPRQVEIVVPVHNERVVLAESIHRLHAYLTRSFPFTWRILIADNASTDGTLAIARALSSELPDVDVLHLRQKGRGRALRAAWAGSPAEVVAYMDVDLSTDLRGLLPLVAPLLSGHSDLAIGTRLAPGAKVVRGPKREVISRGYNRLLHATLRTRFSDAQCGFKAARTVVVQRLLPDVRDDGWFFDTELLVLAQRRGLRIHEVPVDWADDPDSRVEIVPTALADLRGIARLGLASPVVRFCLIGAASTIAYALVYLVLRTAVAAEIANVVALAITAVANTAANRRFTFGVRGRAGGGRDHALGLMVFLAGVALTSGALALLGPGASRGAELAVLVAASAVATATRYLALRFWVFARATKPPAAKRT
jgi:glycosyltransferase involved in cell wall biosynthesis